ncbi:hypothetical protein GvMRE_I2g547 [endosymbiont GvMRE of Glomus versiforme]|nr:hypothetical protein GvMRE_I2g547 [endosymbiont GvMRE of Glomus versiforme]
MIKNIKESKITYLAIGIIAGLALAYAYTKWIKKD